VVEKCFSKDVQFLITNRQSSVTLQRYVKDAVQSPASVDSPGPASQGAASQGLLTSQGLCRVTQASGVFDSSPAVPSPADRTVSVVSCALLTVLGLHPCHVSCL